MKIYRTKRKSSNVTASKNTARSLNHRVKASTTDDFVFYYNGDCLYTGNGSGFANVIERLCKNEKVNTAFQKWCNQFGDSFDFDGTAKDTAIVFAWLVEQEQADTTDFYLDGNIAGNRFECFPASQVAESTRITHRKSTVTAASNSDDVYAEDLTDILVQSGFPTDTWIKKTRTHLGTEFNVYCDRSDVSAIIDTLNDAGYNAKLDQITDTGALLFVTQTDSESGYLYEVSWGYGFSETVSMDYETDDYQQIVDTLIDQLEAEGSEGCFVPDDELDTYPEDEYVIGGNHDRALITNGMLDIRPIGNSVKSSTIANGTSAIHASTDLITL